MIKQKRLVSTFLELVKIDSPSGEEKSISAFVAKKLAQLGGDVVFDNYGNLIAKFKGTGDPVMLNAHLDTVEPGRGIKPQIKGNKILSGGTTILGGDDKAGIAIILETLTSFAESKKPHLPIETLFTLEEETGLFGAVNLDYSKIKSKIGITFDGVGGAENITTSAPGYSRIDATITGRSAHAGFEPEKGISAIKIAAEIIAQLEVGRIDHETTANIGLIEGGSARNAVPEKVHFQAEIRSRMLEKLEAHTAHFEKVFNDTLLKNPESKIKLEIEQEFNPYIFEDSHHVIQKAVKALSLINLKPNLAPSGGGADVNIFHTRGIEAICVGAGFYNPHTTREYVNIPDLTNAATFCEELVSI